MNPSQNTGVPSHNRSMSLEPNTTDMFKRSLSPPPAKNTRERSGSGRSTEPLDSFSPLKKSETIVRTPSRKMSSNGFFRIARQASGTAFRTLKGSNSNMGASKKELHLESSDVYQQNPKFYLYQQQQYQYEQDSSHSDDSLADDWTKVYHNFQSEHSIEQFKTEKLRKNISLPDMNAEYSKDSGDLTVARAASPVNLLPGQATNRGRSRSRQRVQPHLFVTTAMSNEPITASTAEGDTSSEKQKEAPDKKQEPHVGCADQLASHNQQCEHLTKHKVLSEESLLGSLESRSLHGNKDLPPIPHGQTPAFQLCTRVRRKPEGNDSESLLSPVGVVSPILPVASGALKRKESKGLIPQDVLKNMNPKDVQKAIKDTVITSRVYKVMSFEQIDALRKEQDDLEQFIEGMNVSLHIESRMRDASHSLIRLHENNLNMDAVKAATSQLHATTRKMDQIVQKTQEAMWHLMAIQRLLLQHEGAILNAGLRRLDNENRELSRTVIHLDTARDQEKEEKIKWKKEHNRLKFQSILFPSTPVLEEFDKSSSTTADQTSQKHQAQLESMEKYVKELNDEILQKDEKLVEATDELQAVRGWASDFQTSIQGRKPTATEDSQPNSNASLQAQLRELQSAVESELKDMDIQVQEIKSKVDVLLRENNSPVCRTKAGLRSPVSTAPDDDTRFEQRQMRRNCPSFRAKKHARQGSDLQMVLRESLLELDRQIRQDILQSTSPIRPSADPVNSPLSRKTSHRSVGSPLSRTHSSHSSGVGLSDSVQKDNVQIEVSFQESLYASSDEDTPVEDASEEIQRLNTMVHEMQQIVKRHSATIEAAK